MSFSSSFGAARHPGARVMGWHTRGTAFVGALGLAAALVGYEGSASACGACFASASESTVVNDHRMALSISKDHTILWDQISYSGNPQEFAYVIPARPGTRLEPSKEAWFASLDASTRPIIVSPQSAGYGGGYGGGGGGGYQDGYDSAGHSKGSGGCCSSSSLLSSYDDARGGSTSSDAGAAFSGNGSPEAKREPVTVVEEAVVGPYETVTLRANEPGALQKWLVANGYEIPEITAPDGSIAPREGRYSVTDVSGHISTLNASYPTGTGIDVPPGTYKIDVTYTANSGDPKTFTQTVTTP